jgi:Flp pilus assembly protein TadG
MVRISDEGRRAGNRRRRGTALIEFCFILPWYVFLFVGAFDYGFYSYSLISTTTAARVAGYYCASKNGACSASDATMCDYAIGQLKNLPNMGTAVTTCAAAPLTVTRAYNAAGASCPDGAAGNGCVTVTVVYVTPQLVPIPGLLPSQLTITKTATLGLRSL